ncbi:hypothetical protein F5Y11DRAFT_361761 [Daldinia sp. FL1419]|nr:hypothetical protein F5Y11DRAFT_361761 [Daldinia sp. FL1419]
MLINVGVLVHLTANEEDGMLDLASQRSFRRITKDGRIGLDCRVALRLMHCGADSAKVCERNVRYFLEKVYKYKSMRSYFLQRKGNGSPNVDCEPFSQKVTSVDSPLYAEQVYVTATLFKGKVFLDKLFEEVILKMEKTQHVWMSMETDILGSQGSAELRKRLRRRRKPSVSPYKTTRTYRFTPRPLTNDAVEINKGSSDAEFTDESSDEERY